VKHIGYLPIDNIHILILHGLMELIIGDINHLKLINMRNPFNILMLGRFVITGKKFVQLTKLQKNDIQMKLPSGEKF